MDYPKINVDTASVEEMKIFVFDMQKIGKNLQNQFNEINSFVGVIIQKIEEKQIAQGVQDTRVETPFSIDDEEVKITNKK